MRQASHRGLHRPETEHVHRSVFFRLSVVIPVLAFAAAAGGVALLANLSTAAQQAPAATPNPNCSLVVPANPLSATGLSTPFQLVATNAANGPCNETNAAQSAFAEATIIDPATGKLSIYRPLIINQGTKPAAAPVVPTLPAGAVVGLWFGFNGTTLTLTGNGVQQGRCVNGLPGSPFGQVSFCDAQQFFAAANQAIRAGTLVVPPLATAKDGQPCMTTRDFGLIDQDQSDNVVTSYLALANGTIAQNNAANTAALAGANTLVNGSDNLLLDGFVDPAIGCTPFTAPDLTNNGQPVGSLALDELQAAADQKAPIALVPTNDPMVLVNGNASNQKTNLYRSGVDQPPLTAADTPTTYCKNMTTIGQQRTQLDQNLTMNGPSPAPAMANNLFTFLASRLNQSYTNLGCQNLLNMPDPIQVTTDGNGVAIAAKFNVTTTPVTTCGATPSGSTTPAVPTTTGAMSTSTTTGAASGTPSMTMSSGATPTSASTSMSSSVAMTPSVTPSTTASAPPTSATSCASAPPTTTTNADMTAAHHSHHRPRKY